MDSTESFDAVLIGGGIMSATLGIMITKLQPDWSIAMFERLDALALESTNPWNNAGTGHSGLCELNYMPDPGDIARPAAIARQFGVSRQFWSALTESGEISTPAACINPVPHINVVFGRRDVDYLRTRYATMQSSPLFSRMEYTDDADTVAAWAPLVMAGRRGTEPIAATRAADGTDIDFGALTVQLVAAMARAGADIRTGTEVTSLTRNADRTWQVRVRHGRQQRCVTAKFVFCGAGGYALRLLQRAHVREVRGYAVFPLGAQFFRTTDAAVVSRHDAKVYGQADLGAPPMSLPHLDKRVVDGQSALMFGPYPTFSTRLGKHGSLADVFTTIRVGNLWSMVTAGLANLDLGRYLIRQLLTGQAGKFAQLRRLYPLAQQGDWELIQAGQRAQLIKPGPWGRGVLTFGTEVLASADGSIAGLLGASPGASTAPSTMAELLLRCFPEHRQRWRDQLAALMPDVAGSP